MKLRTKGDEYILNIFAPMDKVERARKVATLRGELAEAQLMASSASIPAALAAFVITVAAIDNLDDAPVGWLVVGLSTIVLGATLALSALLRANKTKMRTRLLAEHEEAIRLGVDDWAVAPDGAKSEAA